MMKTEAEVRYKYEELKGATLQNATGRERSPGCSLRRSFPFVTVCSQPFVAVLTRVPQAGSLLLG